MDKETLSNYGWIVICVLVLAVMIALATPFGDYISTAVKSTTQGLFDTNKNALNSTGLINIGDQSFDDSASAPEIKREAGTLIPDGAKYIKADRTILKGNGTNVFPDTPSKDDLYMEGKYVYGYKYEVQGHGIPDEWTVLSITAFEIMIQGTSEDDADQYESYGELCSSIAGRPLTHMIGTFYECTSLATAPTIPSSVTSMDGTFAGCTSLKTVPKIPSSVTNMHSTFQGCTSLVTAPVIPNSVTNMLGTFSRCTSLTTAPAIPNNVTNMNRTFQECSLLTGQTITIPTSVINLNGTSGTWHNGPSWVKQ